MPNTTCNFAQKSPTFTDVGKVQKGSFPLKLSFLGESQGVLRWLSNQISSFRMGTYQFFLNNMQLTFMLQNRIHGFLRTKF